MSKCGLTIFDMDDTLFFTTACVRVMVGDRVKRSLTSHEYKTYQLKKGERFDYSEYQDAELFAATSIPNNPILKKAKDILCHIKDHGCGRMIIITARPDLDDKSLFLDAFRNFGFDIDAVHVHRVGNRTDADRSLSTSEAKAEVIRKHINEGNHKVVRMYDDDPRNIEVFNTLKREFPNTQFLGYVVEGKTVKKVS